MTKPKRARAVHDLREGRWGHNIEFLHRYINGDWRVCIFLKDTIRKGDIVLARSQRGDTLRYSVATPVDTAIDPGDQHFTRLHYEGRDVDSDTQPEG